MVHQVSTGAREEGKERKNQWPGHHDDPTLTLLWKANKRPALSCPATCCLVCWHPEMPVVGSMWQCAALMSPFPSLSSPPPAIPFSKWRRHYPPPSYKPSCTGQWGSMYSQQDRNTWVDRGTHSMEQVSISPTPRDVIHLQGASPPGMSRAIRYSQPHPQEHYSLSLLIGGHSPPTTKLSAQLPTHRISLSDHSLQFGSSVQ